MLLATCYVHLLFGIAMFNCMLNCYVNLLFEIAMFNWYVKLLLNCYGINLAMKLLCY